jgi:ankyrin repeat protein
LDAINEQQMGPVLDRLGFNSPSATSDAYPVSQTPTAPPSAVTEVKAKKRRDDDDDNKSMVSGMTSMTKRSSQHSSKSGSRKQQSMQHAAATAGTLVKLDKMLEAGLDANLTDEEDYTVLMRAVESGNGHIVVRLLKDDHVNPSHAEQLKGRTAMHIACMKGMHGIVIELLKDPRVQVHAKDVKGRTPLHQAVIGNHQDIVQILLAHKGNDPNAKDNEGRTPAHLGTYHSTLAALSILLKHPDVDPNVRDNEGRTAMHIAAARCLTGAAVRIFRTPGFDPNLADNLGFTPLHVCAFSALPEPGKVRSGEALIRETESQVSVGDPAGKIMEVLLEHPETDPNFHTSHGVTPLHLTVQHGRPTLAMLLIAHEKTEIMQKDRRGMTPLDVARSLESDALTFLLESAIQQEHQRRIRDVPHTTPKRPGSHVRPSTAPGKHRVMVEKSRFEWRGILHSSVDDLPPKFRPVVQTNARKPWCGMTKPALTPRQGQINMTDKHVGTPMPVALKKGADARMVDRGRPAAISPRPESVSWHFERTGDFGSQTARLRREYDMQTLRLALRRKGIAASKQGMSTPDGKFQQWKGRSITVAEATAKGWNDGKK